MKLLKSLSICLLGILVVLTTVNVQPVQAALVNYQGNSMSDITWQMGNNKALQKYLAYIADGLGFGWCNGTKSSLVGEDFDVFMDNGGGVHIKAHYDKNDPHAGGAYDYQRLEIVLTNFRYNIDTSNIKYGKPYIKNLGTAVRGSSRLTNNDTKNVATDTYNLAYATTSSHSHSTNVKLTEGFKLSESISIKTAPFGIGGSVNEGIEFSFGSEQGWANENVSGKGTTQTFIGTTTVNPNSYKDIQAVSTMQESDLPYSASAGLWCDVTFNGFLRYSGNARTDHPRNRPTVSVKFGNGGNKNGMADIVDQIDHKNINGYSQWDWNWARNYEGTSNFDGAYVYMSWGVPSTTINGTFTDIEDVHVNLNIGNNVSLGGGASSSGLANGLYSVVNRTSGKALDIYNNSTNNGGNVDQWSKNNGANQLWWLTTNSDGSYKLWNKNSNKLLEVYNSSGNDGANVDQYADNGGTNQQWWITSVGGGYYKVWNKNSKKLLEVVNASKSDGANVQQWYDNGNWCQQWYFQKVN